jgi:hypothetical protein
VNTPVRDGDAQMIARERERRGHAPGIGRRVVHFVRRHGGASGVTPADGVYLSVQGDDARGTAGG